MIARIEIAAVRVQEKGQTSFKSGANGGVPDLAQRFHEELKRPPLAGRSHPAARRGKQALPDRSKVAAPSMSKAPWPASWIIAHPHGNPRFKWNANTLASSKMFTFDP